jgi:hypothetical protein
MFAMSDEQRPPTEEELRAAYEAELKRIRVDDVLVQTIVSLINLGGLRAGMVEGSENERDVEQLHQAIEAIRVLLPIVEPALGRDAAAIRDALSRLQLEYTRLAAQGEPAPADGAEAPAAGEPATPEGPPSEPGQAGPAQRSGRLWVPGQ